MEKVFGFDVGTGSLGIAARYDLTMLCSESLLLPAEAGSLEELRTARRQYRTRLAHAAREAYWRKICTEAGIEVLRSRTPGNRALHLAPIPGDPRLEREFAAAGDDTVYTSCLLRIKLLQGASLEGWQVFKAVRSALQRRGFDRNVPWKNRVNSAKESEEGSDTAQRAMSYEQLLMQYVKGNKEYCYPCYFDAYKMGLWEPDTNTIRKMPQGGVERARGFTPPRELVIAELRQLLKNAAKLFPGLAGKTDEILFGPGREQYASYVDEKRKALGLQEGGAQDWDSLLGQKIPRFDNRQLGFCSLIPRLHTCHADDTAVIEAVFLMKLKNLRFIGQEGREVFLQAETIRTILDGARRKAREKREELRAAGENDKSRIQAAVASAYRLPKTELKKCVKNLSWETLPGNDEVEAPKISARSHFSRPAAKILRDLVLSGESPHAFYKKLQAAPPQGVSVTPDCDDLKFLLLMPDSWSSICVPDMGAEKIRNPGKDVNAAVKELIAEQRSPLIRLRLELFDQQLQKLLNDPKIGKPDRIVIEFVRTDFVGKEQKKKIEDGMKARRQANEDARKKAAELHCSGENYLLKLKLLKEQGYICPYTGDSLSPSEVDTLEIDHIVPRHGGKHGSDSFTNKVVTRHATNDEKNARIPYEYLHGSEKWTAYVERVTKMKFSNRKKRLLLSPDAEKLDEKYSDLCSTAWIARSFRDIAMLRCGWADGAADTERHVIVINGAVTAALRRRYRIDSLLAPDCHDPDSIEKKNRADKRHHALDAMVLTFATFWMRDPSKRDQLLLPEKIDRYYFKRLIDQVNPRNILLPKAAMELTIYGKRTVDGKEVMTKRVPVNELGLNTKHKFEKKIFSKVLPAICDERLQKFLKEEFAKADIVDTEGWNHWCSGLRSPDTGMPVKKIRLVMGDPEEYKNFSKDGDSCRGQYRRGAQHQGQFIYLDEKQKARVLPVYAHGSVFQTRQHLQNKGYTVVGFFQSGCNVKLCEHVVSGKNHAVPEVYLLRTLRADGIIVLHKNGTDYMLSLSAIPDIVNNLKRC